jgi:hypothetical protein
MMIPLLSCHGPLCHGPLFHDRIVMAACVMAGLGPATHVLTTPPPRESRMARPSTAKALEGVFR